METETVADPTPCLRLRKEPIRWSPAAGDKGRGWGDARRPFVEHLEELRRRLIRAALWLAAGTGVCWFSAPRILAWLIEPVEKVVFLSPVEPFLTTLKAAFLGGVAISFPALAWEGWGFLKPALSPRERRWILGAVLASVILFFFGAWLGWELLLPTALKILMGFGAGLMVPMVTVGHYVSFAAWLVIGCGIVFQMPLAVLFLTRMGLVRPRTLLRQWRLAAVALLILAAVLTPGPDILSQMLLLIPLVALYLLSVGVSLWVAPPPDSIQPPVGSAQSADVPAAHEAGGGVAPR